MFVGLDVARAHSQNQFPPIVPSEAPSSHKFPQIPSEVPTNALDVVSILSSARLNGTKHGKWEATSRFYKKGIWRHYLRVISFFSLE
jgi:hypothetical protein